MRDRSEQGIALIAVIWALALLSIIAANLSVEASTSTRVARNLDESAVAQAAADAGIQRAILDFLPPEPGVFAAMEQFMLGGSPAARFAFP
jgi:type II secretory pathway component PulK